MKAFKRIILAISGITILAGIFLIMVAFSMRGSIASESFGDYEFSKTYDSKTDPIRSIDMDISCGDVTIEEGDSFHIEAKNMNEDRFSSKVENGVWVIESDDKPLNYSGIFNVTIPIEFFGINEEEDLPHIVLTIPKDFNAEKADINLEEGAMQIDKLLASELNITVNTGRLKIDDIISNGNSTFTVNTGELVINNCDVNNAKFENNVGHADVTGKITGNCSVTSNVGGVEMNLADSMKDYNFNIDCSIGSARINNNEYYKTNINNKAENSLDLKKGVGDITIDFDED